MENRNCLKCLEPIEHGEPAVDLSGGSKHPHQCGWFHKECLREAYFHPTMMTGRGVFFKCPIHHLHMSKFRDGLFEYMTRASQPPAEVYAPLPPPVLQVVATPAPVPAPELTGIMALLQRMDQRMNDMGQRMNDMDQKISKKRKREDDEETDPDPDLD